MSQLAHWSQRRMRDLWSRTHPPASNRAFPASPYFMSEKLMLIVIHSWGFNIDSYPVIIDRNTSEIKIKIEE